MKVDFWFEFGGTCSCPAAMRIEAIATQMSVQIAWPVYLERDRLEDAISWTAQ